MFVTAIPYLILLVISIAPRGSAFSDPLGIVYAPAMVKRQAFTGSLGGSVPAITDTGNAERPYGVDGDTFTDYASAAERSCNNQFNSCQLIANTDSSASFSLQDCQDQLSQCALPGAHCMLTSVAKCMAVNSSTQKVDHAMRQTTTSEESASNTIAGTLAQTTFPYDDEFDLVCDL
ncbi:hypothetical protein HFD88_009803 [Aspergillus terreus]|nr:hypothetical protein HFD88_009803 [Aspergillus terreus]